MIELKQYQKQAVESLKGKVDNTLRSSENGIVVLQAPTGSGKTVMVSEMLKQLVRNRKDDKKFSFVWVSVRMLHEQSKEKLEKYYEDDRLIQCSYFEDLEDKIEQVVSDLWVVWEHIDTVEDAFKSIIDIKTNNVMTFLALFSAFMLPLTLITSFYWMNVKLPYENNPFFIYICLVVSLFIMFFVYLFFRRNWKI